MEHRQADFDLIRAIADQTGERLRMLLPTTAPAYGICHDWMKTSPEAETLRQQRLAEFLDGYATVRQLSEAERSVIQLTPAIRHIFLMGHVLRHTTAHEGWHWADDAFIDWHMRWFRHWQAKGVANS